MQIALARETLLMSCFIEKSGRNPAPSRIPFRQAALFRDGGTSHYRDESAHYQVRTDSERPSFFLSAFSDEVLRGLGSIG